MNAQIAQHLNVVESAIVKVESWAHVLFVVVRGLGARFVSKKVVKKMSNVIVKKFPAAPAIVTSQVEIDEFEAAIAAQTPKTLSWETPQGQVKAKLGFDHCKGLHYVLPNGRTEKLSKILEQLGRAPKEINLQVGDLLSASDYEYR